MARGRTGEARACYARASHLRDAGAVMIGEALAAELALDCAAGAPRLGSRSRCRPRLLGRCSARLDIYAASIGVRAELALAGDGPQAATIPGGVRRSCPPRAVASDSSAGRWRSAFPQGHFRRGATRPGRCDSGTPAGAGNRQVSGGSLPDTPHGALSGAVGACGIVDRVESTGFGGVVTVTGRVISGVNLGGGVFLPPWCGTSGVTWAALTAFTAGGSRTAPSSSATSGPP